MRFSGPFAVALTVLSACTGVSAASQPITRRNPLNRRATVDVCADVNIVLLPPLIDIEVCLCLGAVTDFVQGSAALRLAVGLLGLNAVVANIQALINRSPNRETCTFPDANFEQQCTSGDPCAFTCTNGFEFNTPTNPTDCICPPPKIVSNGQCIQAPCPSGICARDAVSGLRRRSLFCPHGKTACGVLGRGAKAWECVDTMNDLESCGGCAFALNNGDASGVDCSTLPHVSDVSCHKGACVVGRCLPGFTINSDRTACVADDFVHYGIENNTPL
ncbi:hypothetical protein HGRIS_010837 [Hohenbuehelia grisea]|uniref:Protein CPL1-like domain-containing protein n=1 Tax=Hohenbuehelia grisea TaxID=104357 RepID=A0ABR3IY05_9AGAR